MNRSIRFLGIVTFSVFTLTAVASHADAAMIFGTRIGPFSGNDSASAVGSEVGQAVSQIAKIEDSNGGSSAGFTVTFTTFKDGSEPLGGHWSYIGSEVIDLIAIKAGGKWAIFDFRQAGLGMLNMGLLENDFAANGKGKLKGISHVSAYNVVGSPTFGQLIPEPTSMALLALGAAMIARRPRR